MKAEQVEKVTFVSILASGEEVDVLRHSLGAQNARLKRDLQSAEKCIAKLTSLIWWILVIAVNFVIIALFHWEG